MAAKRRFANRYFNEKRRFASCSWCGSLRICRQVAEAAIESLENPNMTNHPSRVPFWTRPERLPVALNCRLDTSKTRHEGKVVNLSYGGFGIEFDSMENEFHLMTLRTVTVDDLGRFDVEGRWTRGNRIGVRFTDGDAARVSIQKYLDAHGLSLR